MASLFSHPAVPLALGVMLGRHRLPARYWVLGAIASMAPDIDVLAFRLGIPYGAPLGHRGGTHSILVAVIVSTLLMLREWRHWQRHCALLFYLFVAALSHPLLDMLTDGGLGIALLYPFSTERFFFPWRPIAVSPIGAAFFSQAGLEVIASELKWIWLPCSLITALVLAITRAVTRTARLAS
jgi:inner membrane protein